MIRVATEQEIGNWDELVRSNPDGGHIYNSFEWNEFKKTVGWQPHYLVFEQSGYTLYFCIAEKSASFLGTIYYCAKGPGIFKNFSPDKTAESRFKKFCSELKSYISVIDRKAILVKVEPEILDASCDMHQFGLHKSSADLQFKATIFVDLEPTEEEILSGFKQKTRYNINLARRKGVEIRKLPINPSNIDMMFSLMSATQSRAGFFLRKKEYFAMYWKILADASMGQLLAAYHDNDLLAGIFATTFGTKGYYKDGGSYPLKRNLMAPYLLQWEAMRWAKEQGAKCYDLVAVPPRAHLDDPDHPQAGLYQFKRGFCDEVTEFVGCWDLPISASKYKIWKRQERKFLKLYTKMTKNLFW